MQSSPGQVAAALTSPAHKGPRLADTVTASSAGSGEWAEVIVALQPAIVALRVSQVRHFEEDSAATSSGTGFVVDKERGIILTNRHIIGCGPVRATALFDRHEELDVEVLYRDPVHDFGFFKYEPSKLRLTRQAEVPLQPEGLTVGTEIRVVGNDAGEKLQILSGTIARVDRNVPEFSTVYNDENTFYAGAGAGTSGGSSGSPVLNKQGFAIALNAAGQDGTASAFFLPLDRVRYSFNLIRAGKPVPRGTCLTSFLFKPFDELIRVGLQQKHETEVLQAFPDATGMLIVDGVLSEQEQLRAGDILLQIDGKVCVSFVQLEDVVDQRVNSSVSMCICRAGAELELPAVPIRDLHALIPRSFTELGLDILHDLGYHAAKRVNMPLDCGVYLASSGYVFDWLGCGRGALVTAIGAKSTPTLGKLVEALQELPDRQYFPVSWYDLVDFRRDRTLRTGFAKMNRSWSPLRLWRCISQPGSAERWEPENLPMPPSLARHVELGPAANLIGGDPLVRKLQSSLTKVRFRTDRRFNTEGAFGGSSEGFGLLVDAERGLVLTDRHSAPQSLGDVEVTLGGTTTVDAEVLFVHPLHNIAMVQCDTAPLLKAKLPLKSASLATGAQASLRPGERVYFVGFDGQQNTFSTEVTVAAVYLPSGKDEFPMWDIPRFREKNLEIVVLADTPEDARSGVLCDARGTVRALFASFDWQGSQRECGRVEETTESFGIAVSTLAPLVAEFRESPVGHQPTVLSLDAEFCALDVATLLRGAAGKLPPKWLQVVGARCGGQGQVPRALSVSRVLPTGAADKFLKPGDVLLSIDNHPITCSFDIEEALRLSGQKGILDRSVKRRPAGSTAIQRRSASKTPANGEATVQLSKPHVTINVFRDGAEVAVPLTPSQLGSEDDFELMIWAGVVLRKTPRCILESCGESIAHRASGVFAQAIMGGSPADNRDLMSFWFLMDIDGHPVKRLSDVLEALRPDPKEEPSPQHERRWVRLRLLDLNGREHVKAIQSDPLFFPTLVLRRSEAGVWQCVQH